MNKILRIGHRGAMGYEPENTLRSFQKAIDLKVDMIEFDVWRCKSGEIVVFHDEKLKRLTGVKGKINKKTLTELKLLDVGLGEKIPTLEEALDFIDKRVQVNIELKGSRTLKPVLKIIDYYVTEKGWKYSDFLLSTFTRLKLRVIARAKPKSPIGALLNARSLGFIKFSKKIEAYSININLKLASQRLIDKIHKVGLKVFVWTVNDQADIDRLKLMGVDGIFSDFPDRV